MCQCSSFRKESRSRLWNPLSRQSRRCFRLCFRSASTGASWSRLRHSSCHRSRGKGDVSVPSERASASRNALNPSFPRRAVVGSGRRENLAVTLRRGCLKRRWHGRAKRRASFFGRCHRMRVRRYGKPKCLSGGIRGSLRKSRGIRACCESVLGEQTGFRFRVLRGLLC